MTEVLTADRVVTANGVLAPAWIAIDGGKIVELGSGNWSDVAQRIGAASVRELGNVTVVPGFVDTHVHGGGGFGFSGATRDQALAAREAHARCGTTSMMASLVTQNPEQLLRDVRVLAELVRDGTFLGIHLEGPWLSRARAGAHDVGQLRDPDREEIAALLAAAQGTIVMVTLAPELPGASVTIRQFVDAGVVVALGHTDADYDTVRAAIAAGATVATHLFNAMRPVHHREPGPILALMEDERVALELIADGTHLHPSLIAGIEAATAPDRITLVTDAMAAAGIGDGEYMLGDMAVVVANGVARLRESGAIAGSTATMDQLFRARAGARVASDEPWSDAALCAAARQTSTNPARVFQRVDIGDIATGKWADLVVFDEAFHVSQVVRRGN